MIVVAFVLRPLLASCGDYIGIVGTVSLATSLFPELKNRGTVAYNGRRRGIFLNSSVLLAFLFFLVSTVCSRWTWPTSP